MKFKLENQDGVYFLDVYYNDTLKVRSSYLYGTIIFDTKRKEKRYYLIPSETNELSNTFISLMEKIFLVELVPKDVYGYPKFTKGSRTGELSHNVKEKLIDLFRSYDIDIPNLSESDNDKKYYHLLQEYNKGYYPESKML